MVQSLLAEEMLAVETVTEKRHAESRTAQAQTSRSADAVKQLRILVLGATGYIGSAVTRELVARGHHVTAIARAATDADGDEVSHKMGGANIIVGDVRDESDLAAAFDSEVDAVVSCLSSRSGSVSEVWDIDYLASKRALDLLVQQGKPKATYVLLSAICVRTPVLELHRAKLAMERELAESGVAYSIVRPSAYFKSLAGQVSSVLAGRPYILFGDGTHTRANAMSDADVARVLADCLGEAPELRGIVEIGGTGEPITPLEQSRMLFELAGREPEYLYVPLDWLDNIVGVFDAVARVLPPLADAAEAARIARFYATQEMVGPANSNYGQDTLRDFYAELVEAGKRDASARPDLGLPTTSLVALQVLQLLKKAKRVLSPKPDGRPEIGT